MGYINEVAGFTYDKFYFINKYFSKKNFKRLDKDLFQARMNIKAEAYLPMCFALSLTVSFLSLVLFFFTPEYTPSIFFLVFGLGFYLLYNYPRSRKRKLAGNIETELPFALRSMGVELNINVPFETCLGNIAKSDYGLLSKEFQTILRDLNNGSSVNESLNAFSERVDSTFVKRAVSLMTTAYQKGGKSGNIMKKLADEQNALMKSKLTEYNGKLMMTSLIFIAFSAIIPAMFQAFVIIGSSFLSLMITPGMAFWIPVAVFPLIDASILLIIKRRKPYAY